jgi:hypothetical protein
METCAIVGMLCIGGNFREAGAFPYRNGTITIQLAPPGGAQKLAGFGEPDPVAVASQPVDGSVKTLTVWDVQKRALAFTSRQWLESYQKHGQHNAACDAEVMEFIRVWLARTHGGPETNNTLSLEDESERLANDPNCTDPLALTVVANNTGDCNDSIRRYKRAFAAYVGSGYQAYPQLFARAQCIAQLMRIKASGEADQVGVAALKLLTKCFTDGSFTPGDQQELADIFVVGWGTQFLARNGAAICEIVHNAGPSYQWLALVLDGERHINAAWQARGGGYANTVTEKGWQGFGENLAEARKVLPQAWKLQPDFPMAPCLMMKVSLGDSGIQEMRVWFDRTLAAQIDYPDAWSEMRWGLRPRWHGNLEALLALGRTALNTGRFDTDVPYEFIECVGDVQQEMGLSAERHIYSRADIWPELKKMFRGYIAVPERAPQRNGLRTSYAVVAYFAGDYGLAREQLEAMDWKPVPGNLLDWGTDLSRMPLEVAARTGPAGAAVAAAETAFDANNVASALKQYTDLASLPAADARTKEFSQYRLAQLAVENRLHQGEWVDLMPANVQDPIWMISLGKVRRLADGALEVEFGPKGHMLFSKARVSANFEVRGQFEMISSSDGNFEAGLVMGRPDIKGWDWYAFGFRRAFREGTVMYFGDTWSSTQQIAKHATLNDAANSFDFVFRNGKVTASANAVQVFQNASSPMQIPAHITTYLVGFGALSGGTKTVVRYRNVQLRELQ